MPIIQLTNFGALNQLDPSILPNDLGTIPSIIFDIFFGYVPIFILHAILYLMLMRLFLICFHIKFSVVYNTSKVLQFINDSALPQHSWYMDNKSKYGTIHGALRLFAIPYFISCAIGCCIYAIFDGYKWQFEMVNPILCCVPIIASQIIWAKTPKFNDYFQIRREVLGTSIGAVIGIIVYSMLSIAYVVLYFYDIDALILQRLSCLILIVLLGHTNLFMTLWVLRNSGRHSIDRQRLNPMIQYPFDSEVDQTAYKRMENIKGIGCNSCCQWIGSSHPLSHCEMLLDMSFDPDSISRTDTKGRRLIDVLSDPEGFDFFVMHLMKEFSTENVLAVVEMTQYRLYYQNLEWNSDLINRPMQNNARDNVIAGYNANNRLIEIPEHVPKSEVLYDWELEMVDKVRHLVEKYIEEGARFQLNISGVERKEIMEKYQQLILGAMDEAEGQYMFDTVRNSIMNLMGDSLTRFETTQEYKMIRFKNTH